MALGAEAYALDEENGEERREVLMEVVVESWVLLAWLDVFGESFSLMGSLVVVREDWELEIFSSITSP